MEGFDADVGSFQAALQKGPEILDPVGVHVAANVLFGVVHELVNVIFLEASVGRQFIGEDFGTRLDVRAHFLLERAALAVRYVLHAHLSGLAIQQPITNSFPAPPVPVIFSAFLSLCMKRASPPIMVSSASTGPVPPIFLEAAALHSLTNPMEHEPRGLLSDFQIARDFVTADPVLAIDYQPHGDQPLVERERAVLENRADFNRELPDGRAFGCTSTTAA